jgi:hypothetical protein
MHLILLFHPRESVRPELTEFALSLDNPRARLNTHRDLKISVGSSDDFDPALFVQGTLYAYVEVLNTDGIAENPVPNATLRFKGSDLYPIIMSLGRQLGVLYGRNAIRVIPPVPVDLVVLKARQI